MLKMSSTHKIISQKSIFLVDLGVISCFSTPPIFSLFLLHLQNVPALCICFLFAIWLLFPLPVYFRYVASLCVLTVVGFLGSDLTTPGPQCEVFDDDDEVRYELVFIGPESDHWQCLSLTDSLTNSLTHCCLVNLIDVTLACEDAYSKLVEVVTVIDVDDENRVGNSLLQIWKLRFGHKCKLLVRLWA